LPPYPGPPAERIVDSLRVYGGRILSLRLDTVERLDGRRLTHEVVEHDPVVAMVPIDAEGNVLLVRQYRAAPDEVTLEIPAGGVDTGESLEEAAQRELQEETGCRAGRLERLASFYVSPGYCSEFIHMFQAWELSSSPRQGDPEEEGIAVLSLPLAEAVEKIRSGEIRDAKSIIGLLLVSR
jgi:ADP-ribose pyrophosphatase